MSESNTDFLKLNNVVIDELMPTLSGGEFKCLMAIIRKTTGWNKKIDGISITQFMAMTGLSNRVVIKSLKALKDKKIVHAEGVGARGLSVYGLCDLDNFQIENNSSESDPKKPSTRDEKSPVTKSHPCKKVTSTYDEKSPVLVTKSHTQKTLSKDTNQKTLIKKTNKKDFSVPALNVSFEVFWTAYDKKINRPACEKKWISLSDQQRFDAMAHVADYVLNTPDKKFRKHPATYLNQEAWNDEIIEQGRSGFDFERANQSDDWINHWDDNPFDNQPAHGNESSVCEPPRDDSEQPCPRYYQEPKNAQSAFCEPYGRIGTGSASPYSAGCQDRGMAVPPVGGDFPAVDNLVFLPRTAGRG